MSFDCELPMFSLHPTPSSSVAQTRPVPKYRAYRRTCCSSHGSALAPATAAVIAAVARVATARRCHVATARLATVVAAVATARLATIVAAVAVCRLVRCLGLGFT